MSAKNRGLKIVVFILLAFIIAPIPAYAEAKRTVAVLGLKDSTGTFIRGLEELSRTLLSSFLTESVSLTVVEREYLEQVIDEQKYSLSGLFDLGDTSLELGRLLVADYLLAGSLNSFAFDTASVQHLYEREPQSFADAYIRINSDLQGAKVFIDGEYVGKTPLALYVPGRRKYKALMA